MKVLIINTVDTARNGITNVVFNHLKELSDSDIVFDMVVKNEIDSSYENYVKKSGGHVFLFPRKLKTIVGYIKSLRKLIRSRAYDIVHIHGNSHTLVIELLAASLGGCKVRIIHAHNTVCNSIWLHKGLSGLFNALCTHRLACSKKAGVFMYGDHSFEVLKNGIDVKSYSFDDKIRHNVRKYYGIDEFIVLGHVGFFNEAKNQSLLLDILKELLKMNPQYRLLLVGSGPLIEKIKTKAIRLKVTEQVVFVGETDNVSAYLSAMDMFLMPSLYEGLPLTMIEAQANGLKCIASDRITNEVDQTGNVQFLSIDEGSASWVKAIKEFDVKTERLDDSRKAIDCIIKHGYSIHEEAQKLYEYYHNAIKV